MISSAITTTADSSNAQGRTGPSLRDLQVLLPGCASGLVAAIRLVGGEFRIEASGFRESLGFRI